MIAQPRVFPLRVADIMLFCVVIGENSVFPITLGSARFVGELKQLIKDRNPHTLDGCDAAKLMLYKTNIKLSNDDRFIAEVNEEPKLKQNELLAWLRVLDYFPESPPENALHILVGVPGEFIDSRILSCGSCQSHRSPAECSRLVGRSSRCWGLLVTSLRLCYR